MTSPPTRPSSKRARTPRDPPLADDVSTTPAGTPTAHAHAQIKKLRLSMGSSASADTSISSSHSASTSRSAGRAPSLVHSGTPSSHADSLSHGLPSPAGSDSFAAGVQSSIRSHTEGELDMTEESVASPHPGRAGGSAPPASFKLGPPSSLLAQVSVQNGNSQSPLQMFSSPPVASASAKKRMSIGSPGPSSPLQVQHLPLALLSHIFTALLVPRRRNRTPSVIPLPNLLLSLSLLRSSLGASSALSPKEEVELRVLEGWVGLETGKVMLAKAGAGQDGKPEWSERGKRELRETETGLGKGIILCQKHPHLSPYLHQLTIFQAETASLQGNSKFAIKTLKRSLTSATSLPLHQHYALLLTIANQHLSTTSSSASTHALSALTLIQKLAATHSHTTLVVVAQVARVGILVREGSWRQARDLLGPLGDAVGYVPPLPPPPKEGSASKPEVKVEPTDPKVEPPAVVVPPSKSPLEKQVYTHFLCLGSLVHNHLGEGTKATGMIKALHAILDEGTEGDAGLGGGVWEIPIPIANKVPTSSPSTTMEQSLFVRFTPPHLVYILACLFTCISKKDPTGKRPKKTIFADEGLRQLGATGEQEITYPPGSSSRAALEWSATRSMLEAELRCEALGVAIVRSDFDGAQSQLSDLISFTRSTSLFLHFAPRITLLQAHLAQSLGRSDKALSYYRAAHHLARHPSSPPQSATCLSPSALTDLAMAAKLGEMGLMVGLGRLGEVREECEKVAKAAWGNAGQVGAEAAMKDGEGQDDVVLKIGGGLLTALMENEILKSKKHLKVCLDFASSSSDNTARPLVLSLTAALFINTREKQSLVMLQTALQLARSLGKEGTGGNATLGLWLGQKYEHTLRRNGDEKKATEIAKLNNAHLKTLAEQAAKNEAAAAFSTQAIQTE